MKRKLLIIGASGHGKVVADIATKMNRWDTIEFLDDNGEIDDCMGFKIIGKADDYLKYKDEADFIVAIGNNDIREKIQMNLEKNNLSIATLVHPDAIIGIDVEIGLGSVIMAGVVINSSTKIGKGCIINTSSSLDHDNTIGDYVHVSPGVNIAGSVNISDKTWVGVGAVISNNINVCEDCIIGAGAVVIKDIINPGIYIGIPVIRKD